MEAMIVSVYIIFCLHLPTTHDSREDSGILSKRPGYQITMKKVAQLQEKIEGWEVSHMPGVQLLLSMYMCTHTHVSPISSTLECVCVCVCVCVRA